MADLAYQFSHNFSYSHSGDYSPSITDTTGMTWMVAVIGFYSADVANLTSVTLGGVDITGNVIIPTGGYSTFARIYPFKLGALAGSFSFRIQWTGGGYISFYMIVGNGDIDSAVLDGTPAQVQKASTGTTVTPDAFTPTVDKALPIIIAISDAAPTLSPVPYTANANCTRQEYDSVNGIAIFTCPASTPAGTPTNAVLNDSRTENMLPIVFALKPTSSAPASTGNMFMMF